MFTKKQSIFGFLICVSAIILIFFCQTAYYGHMTFHEIDGKHIPRNMPLAQHNVSETIMTHTPVTNCQPINNVCFIKTRKTGSTTLSSIINRWGVNNNLSFAVMKTNKLSGHFNSLVFTDDSPKLHFLPPLNVKPGDWDAYKYNIMAVHVRYNRTAFDKFMLPGNKYISIIREPASQYESAFNYYKIASVVQTFNKSVRYEDTMEEFMRLPEFYWSKTVAKYGQLISFYTRNTQIYDLGLDHNTHHNISTVLSHINKLKKELDLVLLVDYFDESIVLLKKLLCWTWDDVVYLARNARPDGTRKELSMELRQKVIQWNSADHLLYQEFNRTLWAKVAEYGPQFKDDLEELRFRRNKTETECVGKNKTIVLDGRKQVVYNNVINPPNYCYLLTKFNNDIIHQIMEKQSSGFYLNNTSGNEMVCGFEYRSNCGYTISSNSQYKWIFNSQAMMADKTTGSREGTYLAADVSPGSKAVTMYTRLLLPGQHPGSYKLTFHFVIPSATKKACRTSDAFLRVFVLYTLPSANDASKITSNVEWKSLSSLCNTGGMNSFDACSTLWYIDSTMDTHYGNNWNHVMINVTNKFDHKIVFEARRHSFPSEHCTDFGIDDISITPYST